MNGDEEDVAIAETQTRTPAQRLGRRLAHRSENRDHELVSTGDGDQRPPGNGMPRRERAGTSSAPRRGALWLDVETHDAGAGVWGMFPDRFLAFALKHLNCPANQVLHVCSGGLRRGHGGVRVDIRPDATPDVVADGRALPFRDAAFRAVLIDPPWSVEYARDLYGTAYPRPSHLLAEAARVCRPGGRIGFVHFLVPNPPAGASIVRVLGITQGCGYRIRALTIYERERAELFATSGDSAR